MDRNVKILEDKVNEGFKAEGAPRKKDYENVEEKCAQNEGRTQERRKWETVSSKRTS